MQLFIVHFFDVSSSFNNDVVGVFSTREKAIEYVRSTSEAEYEDDEEFLSEYIEECTLDVPMLVEGDDGWSVKR
jgi:hypothetical protein